MQGATSINESFRSEKHMPEMMRIMEDVFIASNFWLERRSSRAIKLGITHVVLDY